MTSNDFNNAEIAELIFQEDTNLTNCSTDELLTKKEQLGRISRMAKVASENIDRCLDRTY